MQPTGVEYFFTMDASNSIVSANVSRSCFTVSLDPAFDSKPVMSSLETGNLVNITAYK